MFQMIFTNQDYSIPSGFKRPYVCWAVLWIYNNFKDYCSPPQRNTLQIGLQWILSVYQVILIIPWTFVHCFLNEGGKYMNKRWIWNNLLSFHGNDLFKVPKPRYPSDTNSRQRDKESLNSYNPSPSQSQRSSLNSSSRQGAASAALPSWLHNQHQLHLCSTAAVEEQQQAAAGSREAEEHLSGMLVA